MEAFSKGRVTRGTLPGGLVLQHLPAFPRVVSSWIERRKVQSEKANLMILFDKYLPTCLDKLRFGFMPVQVQSGHYVSHVPQAAWRLQCFSLGLSCMGLFVPLGLH